MKKRALAKDTLELYAEKFMTLSEIAKKLKVNEKTLYRWKKADNWEEKKYKFIKNQSSLHQEDEIAAEKRKMAETKPKGLSQETIREIEKSVLGICYEK